MIGYFDPWGEGFGFLLHGTGFVLQPAPSTHVVRPFAL